MSNPVFAGKNALLVDDSDKIRHDMLQLLLELGLKVTEATNGLEGIAKAREQSFFIIFTDLVMPEMDGFELCEEIRKVQLCAATPIVAISTYADSHYITRALRKGADDFLVKPVTMDALLRVIQRVTRPVLDGY